MALKPLNPAFLPLGQFDLADAAVGAISGGEHVTFGSTSGPEGYAADVGFSGPLDASAFPAFKSVYVTPATGAFGSFSGLADEGVEGYGTLFGSLIGQTAGQATKVNGSVVIGPATHSGSGKCTVWAMPGVYGISGPAANDAADPISEGSATNDPVYANATTGLLTNDVTGQGDQVAIYIGAVVDSSLVSTTKLAAGIPLSSITTSELEYHAIFFLGSQGA